MPPSYNVGPATRVSLSYEIRDEDGDLVDATEPSEPLVYIHGFGQILPAFERCVEGLPPGQTRTMQLPPAEAFGEHDPDGLFQLHRSEFPDPGAIELDDEFEVEGPDGEEISVRVVDFAEEDHVLVDTNHPLAGATLSVRVTVEEVQPATEEEIEEAERRLLEQEGPPEPSELIQLGRKPRKA